MRVSVSGVGAVGARAARQLLSTAAVDQVVVTDERSHVSDAVVRSLGEGARVAEGPHGWLDDIDVAVLATRPGSHGELARTAVLAGVSVVSVSDSVDDVSALLSLDARAKAHGCRVIAGAGFMPGLSDVLAVHAARQFDSVEEIHVAKSGTGGPACARQHHRALSSTSLDWKDGAWVRRAGGSGRELCWFPEPVAAVDCYRAALPDPELLLEAFPDAQRITARMSATRRDRMTMHLPMLRPPHPEGGRGAIRVELRGRIAGEYQVVTLGAADYPAVASGAVASLAAEWIGAGRTGPVGASGLGPAVDSVAFLDALVRRGVHLSAFAGAD